MRETGLTSASKSMITARLNDYYSQLVGEEDWKWLEKLFTITTVSGQESYNLDIQNLSIKSVWLEKSSTDKTLPLQEVINPQEWDTISNYYVNSQTDYPSRFHVRMGKIYVFPKISTAGYSLKVLCTANPAPMEVEDYSTGTIAVTINDETVTGTGTLWAANIKEGARIKIKRKWYTVGTVTDNTHLELTQKYQDATESSISDYRIGDAPILPDNYHSILWKMFCEEYFAKNPSGQKAQAYERMVMKAKAGLQKISSSESTTNIWDNNPRKDTYIYRDPYTVIAD